MSRLPEDLAEPSGPEASPMNLRAVALAELIATMALAACTLIAATAISIGIARADIAGSDLRTLAATDTAPFAFAWLSGLLLAGTGGLAALRIGVRRRG